MWQLWAKISWLSPETAGYDGVEGKFAAPLQSSRLNLTIQRESGCMHGVALSIASIWMIAAGVLGGVVSAIFGLVDWLAILQATPS
jgi:hypothetical protein